MDLGLAGAEYRDLVAEITTIVHCAAAYYLGVPREMAMRVNVEGTRNVLELAGACARLERLCHFSTAFVSGDRKGVIMEDELDARQRFRHAYEETKFRAELLVREAAHRLPVVVMRPAGPTLVDTYVTPEEARALLVDPRILVLDDALSAVDTYTEEEILSRLRDVMRERTSIIVSHRISTVRGADLIALASILRIPVCMHNVPEERIFRPSAWTAFGTSDLQGADFRACENFGPLYGRYAA